MNFKEFIKSIGRIGVNVIFTILFYFLIFFILLYHYFIRLGLEPIVAFGLIFLMLYIPKRLINEMFKKDKNKGVDRKWKTIKWS